MIGQQPASRAWATLALVSTYYPIPILYILLHRRRETPSSCPASFPFSTFASDGQTGLERVECLVLAIAGVSRGCFGIQYFSSFPFVLYIDRRCRSGNGLLRFLMESQTGRWAGEYIAFEHPVLATVTVVRGRSCFTGLLM